MFFESKNSTVNRRESKEGIVRHQEVFIYIRHGQRGVHEGATYLTDYGKKQAKTTGLLLKAQGIDVTSFDNIEIQSSYSGDCHPISGLPRAAETAQLVADGLGVVIGDNKPERLSHVELENTIHSAHYNHNEVLRSYLPSNYDILNTEEKLKAEQEALSKTLNDAMSDGSPEALAYMNEIAGAAAFILLSQLNIIRSEKLDARSLLIVGAHSTFIEWLFHKALIWKDEKGIRHKGYHFLGDIGGALNYAEAVVFDIRRAKTSLFEPIRVHFTNPERSIQEAYLDLETSFILAESYANLHKIPFLV